MNEAAGIFRESAGLNWLVLDLNSFFASCEQQANPDLRGRPVAVVPGFADTTCAIAASYEAKACGVKTGTKLFEAKRLCPDLVMVKASHKLYVEYHHRILKAIDEIIPVDKVMSIDEVACRLDRTQRSPEAARVLGLRLKAHIRVRVGDCLTSSVGIAPNRFLAKLASNLQKPNGLTILEPERLQAVLESLDLRALPGIGRNMETRLHSSGIHSMQALWAASPESLRRIWGGIGGVKFHALLHGADLIDPPNARRSMSHQHVLAPDKRTHALALPVFRELAVKSAERLRREGYYCRRIGLDVKWDRAGGHWTAETAFHETFDTAFLLRRVESMAARMPPGRPLRVGIAVSGLVAVESHQPDLFAQPQRQELTRALDWLNGRFGRNTVGYGACVPLATGKIAFQRVPDLAEF